MNLIPIAISEIKYDSVFNSTTNLNEIRLTFNVEVVNSGDFSPFVKDGKLDAEKLIVAIFNGDVFISSIVKK